MSEPRWVRWLPLVLGLGFLGGCSDPLVGGECLPGLSVCDGRCISLDYDSLNCGACGHVCAGESSCFQGVCHPAGDAGVPDGAGDGGEPVDGGGESDAGVDDGGIGDGGTDDGGTHDGGTHDGGTGDGGTDGGAGTPSCDVGQLYCADSCVDPDSNNQHCGGCDRPCLGGEVCAGGTCAAMCEAPRAECDGVCVDTRTHADHCGDCGVRCDSGICVDGECSAGFVGRVVVIGHDYTQSRVGMNRLAGNAVFLASGAPVRVLVYEGSATDASVQGVDRAIVQVADATGRDWEREVALADEVPFKLAQSEVLLVYSQHGATDAELLSLGTSWATALETFLRRGGVVVLFDGGGNHGGTWQVLDAAGLFLAEGRVDVSGEPVNVVAPGDAVALNVPRTYRAEANSVRFLTTEETVVTEHAQGPVVVHRVIVP
jgi:hypothetical protein